MKVLAVGGSGGMGKVAVKTLVANNYCDHIVVADINGETARDFADECGPSVSWIQLDISNAASLNRALKDVDIVMNTVGPYFKYGVLVLKACIQNGCHYLDINDDWEPTEEMLNLNEDARNAGITAIIGMGASPGLTNLLGAKAISELDRVDEIYTGWDLDTAKPDVVNKEPSAALVHAMHQMTGTIRVFRNGDFVDEKPLQKIKLDYPGMGPRAVRSFGHPEAITFPRYYPTLQTSLNVMVTAPANLFGIHIITWLVNRGLMSERMAGGLIEKAEGPRDPAQTPEMILEHYLANIDSKMPPLYALAKGTKNNNPAVAASMLIASPPGGMGGSTSVPLALGVSMVADGQAKKPGVFAPEGIFDPDSFFTRLAPLCSPAKADLNDILLTTRSWEPDRVIDILEKKRSSGNV